MTASGRSISVPRPTLERLPGYLSYLKICHSRGMTHISATRIAEDLKLHHVQVRKDLASISSGGRPRTGYEIAALIEDIDSFLGYGKVRTAVLVGAGQLGRTLLSYQGFADYGLEIIAAFDVNEEIIGSRIAGKPVYSIDELQNVCRRMDVHIGIITVPMTQAQHVCDLLADSGILAVWNFAPVHLRVPEHVIVQNENMAVSLAILSKQLDERLTAADKYSGNDDSV